MDDALLYLYTSTTPVPSLDMFIRIYFAPYYDDDVVDDKDLVLSLSVVVLV